MKSKFILALLFSASAIAMSAQGYKDGIEYYRAGQNGDAEIILTRTLDNPDTDRSTSLYFLGQIAFQNGDTAKAQELFDQGVAADANNPYNYIGQGEILLAKGDKSSAEKLFKKARGFNKKDIDVIVEVARTYYDVDGTKYAKEIRKAIDDARKINANDPAINILEADMLADAKEYGAAAGYYEMAMSDADAVSYPEAFVKYARTYFNVNPRFAINGLERYVQMQPNSALGLRELAEKYYDNNQLNKAAEIYGKYIQNPNHFRRDEQRYVGLLYFGKDYEKSNLYAAKILDEDPENFFMQRMQLYNYIALNDSVNVATSADRFFATPDGDFNAYDYVTYGDFLSKNNQDSLAIVQYKNAIDVAPEKVELLKDLSSLYASAGMFGKAAEAQQQFINSGDYSTNDLVILARRYMNAAANSEIGSEEHDAYAQKGLEIINGIYELVPDNYTVISMRGRLVYIANNNQTNDEVVAALMDMYNKLEEDPENVTKYKADYSFILNELGKYYMDKDDRENAKIYYTRFLEINPENEALREYVNKYVLK